MNSRGEEHNNNTRRVSRGGKFKKGTQLFLDQDQRQKENKK